MEDKVTLQRIMLLHPRLRPEVEHIYRAQIVPALSGRAICRFAYTLRTLEEQANLYAQGRTRFFDSKGNRLGIVTNAKAGESFHNYGLALDIVLLVNGAASYDTVADFDKDKQADWMEVVNIFKRNGWTWGGDFKRLVDKPHLEKTFGYSVRQLKSKYDKKDFIAGTNYLNI